MKFRLARRLLFNYFVGSDHPTEDGVTGTTTSPNSDTIRVVVIVLVVIAVVALITAAVKTRTPQEVTYFLSLFYSFMSKSVM